MASTTTNLGLTKPAYSDDADISDINGNMDLIDAEAGRVRANVAANYDSSETYAVGDYCLHDGSLYKCSTAISSPEAWTAGHWTQIKITGELSVLNGKIKTDVVTTRDGNGIFVSVNSGFLSSGKVTCALIGKQLTICVQGISTKNSLDWVCQLWQEFRPEGNANYYFAYYLGNAIKRGYVQGDGLVYFEELNTTDMINATIIINVP